MPRRLPLALISAMRPAPALPGIPSRQRRRAARRRSSPASISAANWRGRCSGVAEPAALHDQAQVVLGREIHRCHDVTRRFGGHSVDARGRRPRIDPSPWSRSAPVVCSGYGLLRFLRTSWQAWLPGMAWQAVSGDLSSMNWPPTSLLSVSQRAAEGQFGSDGLT